MANQIPESLRQILAEQYEEAQLTKILAQAFNYGISVVFHPDGSRQIFPETTIDIGLSTSDGDLAAIEGLLTNSSKFTPKDRVLPALGNFG